MDRLLLARDKPFRKLHNHIYTLDVNITQKTKCTFKLLQLLQENY